MASGGLRAPISASEQLFIGEDRPIEIAVVDEHNEPVDMTGWALTWELLDEPGGNVIVSKTTPVGIVIQDGENTEGNNDAALISLFDTDTEGEGPGTYYHVLRRTDADNEVVLAEGPVKLGQASLS